MSNQREQPDRSFTGAESALAWFILIGTLLLLLLVVAPGRGAGWIQDDGLFLRMSWDAAHGFGLDHMLPQSPSYLFHAGLIKLGLIEYLHFRYLNYLVIAVSALLFFGALTPSMGHPLLPLSILTSLLVSLNSVLNPNTLSMTLWLIATGFYFYSTRTKSQWARSLLYALSGIFFGYAGFMHAAVAIAMMLMVLLILTLESTARRSLMLPLFILCVAIPWWLYAYTVGMEVLFADPAGHDASFNQILRRIGLLLLFYCKPLFLYVACQYFWRRRPDKLVYTRRMLTWTFTAWALISTAVFLLDSEWRFPGWVGISQIPGILLVLLYLAFFQWSGLQLGKAGDMTTMRERLRTMFEASRITLKDDQSRRLFVAFAGFILVPAALAVGSNTAIIQGMVFFAGPAMGVLMLLWHHLGNARLRLDEKTLITIWLLILSGFAMAYNHPNYRRPLTPGMQVLQELPLQGVRESAAYIHSLTQLRQAYSKYGCAGHPLLVLDYLPMIYFILQHPAPQAIGVIRPQMYFPEDKILSLLDSEPSWCVLDATGIETQTDTATRQGQDVRARVRTRIEQLTLSHTVISEPSAEIISPMTLYTRTQTTQIAKPK